MGTRFVILVLLAASSFADDHQNKIADINAFIDSLPDRENVHVGHDGHAGHGAPESNPHDGHAGHDAHNAHANHGDHDVHANHGAGKQALDSHANHEADHGAHDGHVNHGAHDAHADHAAHANHGADNGALESHANHGAHDAHADHAAHANHGADNEALESHANHGAHDAHANHGAHGGHEGHMMKMWFHGGYNEVVLFDFWRIDSFSGMFVSCIIVFIMGVLYEALKYTRTVIRPMYATKQLTAAEVPLNSSESKENNRNCPSTNQTAADPEVATTFIKTPSKTQLLVHRIVLGFVYVLQLTLAYWLMLIVMTYNTYLTAAVIFGAGFGVFLFNTILPGDVDTSDACH